MEAEVNKTTKAERAEATIGRYPILRSNGLIINPPPIPNIPDKIPERYDLNKSPGADGQGEGGLYFRQ